MLSRGANAQEALETLQKALAIKITARRVPTPVGDVIITPRTLPHLVEKRDDARERYANFILPTLERPDEVWATDYDDATTRQRYIKLFSGSKYDLMVIVRVDPDGNLFWNMMQRERKTMNALRVGKLLYFKNE